MRVPITDKYLKNIELPPPGRSRLDYDTSDPSLFRGFAVCVTASGSISFRCVYTTPQGESRRHVFGHYPRMSVNAARKEFIRLRELIEKGGDPGLILHGTAVLRAAGAGKEGWGSHTETPARYFFPSLP